MKHSSRSRLMKFVLACWMAVIVALIPDPQAEAASFNYYAFPKGSVGLKKPTIGYSLVSTSFTSQINYFSLKLDGREVAGKLDPGTNTYAYTPTDDLAAGEHEVDLELSLQGYDPIRQHWTFRVSEAAVSELPRTFTDEQQEGVKKINDYRALFGLQPLRINGNLTLAANLHAQYLRDNRVDGSKVSLHQERSALPGFTGGDPFQRVVYAGYGRSAAEDVSMNGGSLEQSIDSLFDAPYHRIPYLLPNATDIGLDKEGGYVVLEFGFDNDNKTELVVSPAPGDPYVPIDFNGHEIPDPLRMHKGGKYPVGYPLMAMVAGRFAKEVKLEEAKLTDSEGVSVELLQNTPKNDDELKTDVILIPKLPLRPDTAYTAYVKLFVTEDGTSYPLEKRWSFRTEPAATVGKTKLHADSSAYVKQIGQTGALEHVAAFGLADSKYTVDGVQLALKRAPLIIDGTSYLWVRDLSDALGATVTWDERKKAAVYLKNGREITFFTDRSAYAVNGAEHESEVSAKLRDSLTVIPVRLLSEVLGAKVAYDDATRTVTIRY